MPFQLVETHRLYQQVADQIGSLIRNGEFQIGERLPPERELAKQLGVSRPVVREAMIALELGGFVEVRGGAGAFIRSAGAAAGQTRAAAADPGPSPFELIAARQLVEGEIAFVAAGRATDADLDRLGEAIELMRTDIAAGKDSRAADREFHLRVAAITGNVVLTGMVDELWAHMLDPIFDRLGRHAGVRGEDRMTIADHAAIVDAMERHDPAEARAAMRAHLAHVERILLREDFEDGAG